MASTDLTLSDRKSVSELLLDWYGAHKRDLPWRRTRDAYGVWVSEIMCQQTTVSAVIPFYERWMAAFPTVRDLADAPLDDVLKLWAGLGYYARARNLHRAAKSVVDQHGGEVPSDPKVLRSLPGIGRYTAGAILSIAFDLDEPVVDANVIRVLSRLFAVEGDPKTSAAAQERIWTHAAELLPPGRAGDFNQALMELGALVCDPSTPRCDSCPVRPHCRAFADGDPRAFPQFQKRDHWTSFDDVAVAVRNGRGEVALAKRAASEPLWGGLWELPRATRRPDEALEACGARAVREGLGVEVESLRRFGIVNHVVAKRKITLHGYVADVEDATASRALLGREGMGYEAVAWEPMTSIATTYAMSTPQARLLAELAKHEVQGALEFE